MSISEDNRATLKISNAPSPSDNSFFSTDLHPKVPEMGKRLVKVSNTIYTEASDLAGAAVGEEITLMRWGVVKITKADDATGTYEVRASEAKWSERNEGGRRASGDM